MSFFVEFMGPDGLPVEITPDVYNESTHRGHLRCPEDGCVAPMGFRKGGPVKGCKNDRPDHFYTLQSKDKGHAAGCPTIDPKVKRDVVKIEDAFDANGFILVHLNYDMPKGQTRRPPEFDQRSWLEYLGLQPRAAFQRAANGATVSVKNLAEYNRYRKTIETVGRMKGFKNPFGNVHVAYKGAVGHWDQFDIDHALNGYNKLFARLFNARTSFSPSYFFGAVHRIHFGNGTFEEDIKRPTYVSGRAHPILTRKEREIWAGDTILFYKDTPLGQRIDSVRDILNRAGSALVMADPEMHNWQRDQWRDGRSSNINLMWKINDISQIWLEDRALNRELRALAAPPPSTLVA